MLKRLPISQVKEVADQWHFGYKAHVGVDKDSGLVHHLEVTSANEHDVTAVSELAKTSGHYVSVAGELKILGVFFSGYKA